MFFIFKKTALFLALLYLFVNDVAAESIYTQDRSLFPYELLEIKAEKEDIVLEGFALLRDKHHFISNKSHEYALILKSKNDYFEIPAQHLAYDLSYMMQYRGYPRCSQNRLGAKNCNYYFKNVGFRAKIPINKLKINEEYEVFLKLRSKVLKQDFITALYYPQDYEKSLEFQQDRLHIKSSYKKMQLEQFYHTLVARTGPSPYTKALSLGKDCSKAYANTAFFKENSRFDQILAVERYKNLVTYYKVNVKDAGCYRLRRRVEEGKGSIAYLPSLYVHYSGDALKILREAIYRKPVIEANDLSIWQYDSIDFKEHARAWDEREGDISDRLKVETGDFTSRIPGKYPIVYRVQNRYGLKSKRKITLTVKKRPSRFRFIDQLNLQDYVYKNSFWKMRPYLDELRRAVFSS